MERVADEVDQPRILLVVYTGPARPGARRTAAIEAAMLEATEREIGTLPLMAAVRERLGERPSNDEWTHTINGLLRRGSLRVRREINERHFFTRVPI